MSFLFKEFKKSFYSKFNNFEIFDGLEFNYFKLAIEGLKVDYINKGKFSTPIFYNEIIFRIFFFLKKVKNILNGNLKRLQSHLLIAKLYKDSDYMILDPGRTIMNYSGEEIPVYFHNIYTFLKRNSSVFYASEIKIDSYNDFVDEYSDLPLFKGSISHSDSFLLRKELKAVFLKIKADSNFSKVELLNIKCAFQKFYDESIFWLKILEVLNPNKIYMICHYHREGLIFAAKKLKIKVIEYQHGLIAKSDIFYNFPPKIKEIKKDCLFPYEIITFGTYWSDMLSSGNFIANNKIKVEKFSIYSRKEINPYEKEFFSKLINNKKIILVTTQTYLSTIFINYIDNLIRILSDEYCIVIKPHPKESISEYSKYVNQRNVFVSVFPIDILFIKAEIHITIYSTTAFDALRHGLATYFIYSESQSDYINEIFNIIGGEILYDYNTKPWLIENKLSVSSNEFFYEK